VWCNLFPARHSGFNGGSCELSGRSFELMQDLVGFHRGFK